MKLCPKAVAIKQGYWADGLESPRESNRQTAKTRLQNDKRAMVRHLHQHMSYCKLCSK